MDQVAVYLSKTRVNEGDSFAASVAFVDRDGEVLDAPSTVDYKVYCLTTGIVHRDWTAVSVGETASILLDNTDSAIQSRGNKYERKQLTVRANRDDNSQVSGQVVFTVKNQGFNP